MQRLMDEGPEHWTRYDLYSCFVFLGLMQKEEISEDEATEMTPKVTKDLLRTAHAWAFERKA
jgi:hypothetical protein